MPSERTSLPADVVTEAYLKHKGNKTAAADDLGIHRDTFRKLLKLYKIHDLPVAGGSTKPLKHNVLPLPPEGKVFRYILTSAQNNTKVFTAFLKNLEAYKNWLEQDGDTCRIMVSRFCYNKSRYVNRKSQKPGTVTDATKHADLEEVWFDESLSAYICDDPEQHGTCRWQLTPDLFFCSEMQIEPTSQKPLSDLETYTGEASSIFPHTRVSVVPVATLPGNPTKHIYTTGSITAKNYIQKKAGLKAQFHHEFAAALVEVNSSGDWWLRQLCADNKGEFYDCPRGKPIKLSKGQVIENQRAVAINWGDLHREHLPEWRKEYYWGPNNSVIDSLRPKHQIHNDLHGFVARNHHTANNFIERLKLYLSGKDKVDAELQGTVDFLCYSERDYCTTVIVRSNHDTALERWLDEASYKHDLPNAKYFLKAQLARVEAVERGEDWMFLQWACQQMGLPETIRFLKLGESYKICNNTDHPIECGVHGHKGPGGSRGSNSNLAQMGSKLNKGHTHAFFKDGGLWCAGTCSENQDYNDGEPTKWSVTHIVTWNNSKRCGLTERSGSLWA